MSHLTDEIIDDIISWNTNPDAQAVARELKELRAATNKSAELCTCGACNYLETQCDSKSL